jgi:hypothetical protein
LILSTIILTSCSSPFLKYEEPLRLSVDDEIPDVKVKEIGEDPNITKNDIGVIPVEDEPPPPSVPKQLESSESQTTLEGVKSKKSKESRGNKKESSKEISKSSTIQASEFDAKSNTKVKTNTKTIQLLELKPREPLHESSLGFKPGSRRPEKDPFRVGERVTMSVRYFKAQAGELTLEIKPMVEVNGRKSYRWYSSLKTTGMFSHFYSIEDWAETLVDFETLVPSIYTLQVKESAQLKNGKGYFDSSTFKAVYAEKKYTEKKGHQEKHQEWQFAPFAQNVFSAAFYMRVFTYEVGKEFKFHVSDDEKNMLFRGKTLRKERVETEAGTFDTVVVKPEFEVDGVFKPVGDIFFWLTDDDRKLIVRIESEIKIGTLVMDAIKVERGAETN